MKKGELKTRMVFLDLETMSLENDASIISIGAVFGDLRTGEIKDTFYQNVDLQSCVELGLHIGEGVVEWWGKQSKEARKALDKNQVSITVACDLLREWWKGLPGKISGVYGNGLGFDNIILTNAFNAAEIKTPWHWTQNRDLPTLVSLDDSGLKKSIKFEGEKHNALDDAKHQFVYASAIWRKLLT